MVHAVRGRNYALALAATCAVERFQLSPGCEDDDLISLARTVRDTYNRIDVRPVWYPCTEWDGFREPDK
jgi:hypothetical protein